tara:strand:- start:7565 stop:8656 length:1092 start_codon:yes stop_codon:yes gene_type:complete
MNNTINGYLINTYSKIILNALLISFCLGLILNLFEEVEFFKNSNESLILPVVLTLSYIPNLIFINLMPFIIFVSAMWFFISIKNNNELLTLKVFGYSNVKIISLISLISFFWGILILIMINPVTSNMVKYYEKTKSNYSKDTDHLVTINRNGVWIKESKENNLFVINAKKLENNNLMNVSISVISRDNIIKRRIESKKADISNNKWILDEPTVFNFDEKGNISVDQRKLMEFSSFYNVQKLNNLFKNLDTISFFELVTESKKLIFRGYEKTIISEKINSFLALPFFLSLMTILAGIFTINNKNSNNINYFMIAVLTCAVIYYMKDLSVALGKSDRISTEISVWIPVIIIGLINSIGLLQINEK